MSIDVSAFLPELEMTSTMVESVHDLLVGPDHENPRCMVALVAGHELSQAVVVGSDDWYAVERLAGGMTCECLAAQRGATCSHQIAVGIKMAEWHDRQQEWRKPFG